MKQKTRSLCAVISLLSGFFLATCSIFMPPVGSIDSSVLMYVGEAFFFAGSALGIDVMIDHKLRSAQQ